MSDRTTQQRIDPFQELNRYDERDEEYRSNTVYETPRRTRHNGWVKFHAMRDCGSQNVKYVESPRSNPTSERYEYDLYCWGCGHRVPEEEILFIGGEWYTQNGFEVYGRPVDDVWLPSERVLSLGPDPSRDELERALRLTRIEGRGNSLTGFSFGSDPDRWRTCTECENQSPLTFDRKCRMCYDGEWTSRMQDSVSALARLVRERNNSFKHRLPQHVDPLSIHDRAHRGQVLWRRSSSHDTYPKIVIVDRVLQDHDDDHFEYVLTSIVESDSWLVTNEVIATEFYDTGLSQRGYESALSNPRIQRAVESVV